MRPQYNLFDVHPHKLIRMNMIKYFKFCLYFGVILIFYLRVERYKCYMCVSDFCFFFYTFGTSLFFVGRLGLKMDWDMIIFSKVIFYWLLYIAKIRKKFCPFRTQIGFFYQIWVKSTHFEKKSKFLGKWTKLFSHFSQCSRRLIIVHC